MSEFLYHGTATPQLIISSGILRCAPYGHTCVSLTRCFNVAKKFANLEREGLEESLYGVFVFRRRDLIAAGFQLIPYHDEIFGEDARDEQEEQIWEDITLNGTIPFELVDITPGDEPDNLPLWKDRNPARQDHQTFSTHL